MRKHDHSAVETSAGNELLEAQLVALQQEQSDTSHEHLLSLLTERIKELDCLYKLTNLIERNENSLDDILQGAVNLLPTSWQYPDISCARISYRDHVFVTSNFKEGQWRQKSSIVISGRQEGLVEVHYMKKRPKLDEGPFLKEERLLIDAVSNRIAKAIERINTEKQLQVERQALRDANAALHDSLVRSQREKKMLGISIQAKIDKIISPIFYALQTELIPSQLSYIDLLKKTLDDIVTPFVEVNREALTVLSPVELQISNMIKHGLSTKNIAQLRGISPATVNRHRESIRRKLGITNSKVNLTSYLNKSGL